MSSSNPESKFEKKLIRVLIVDDNEQVREELRNLLQVSGDVEIVSEASDGREAIRQAERLLPDVVILDLEMPILDGIRAAAEIKQRKSAGRIVVLSVHSDPHDINRAMQAGADCFVQKGSPYHILMDAIIPKKL